MSRNCFRFLSVCILISTLGRISAAQDNTVGLIERSPGAFEGYTLLAPLADTLTYLLDMDGFIVHRWDHEVRPGASTYLLDNGKLLRAGNRANEQFPAGGRGGRMEIIEQDGTVSWQFVYSDTLKSLHHDMAWMPDGNVLMIAWVYKSFDDAVQAGRDPASIPDGELFPEQLIEVMPTDSVSGEIVWEWNVWDHLVQDRDDEKDNFGNVASNPQLVDINFGTKAADWLHFNAVNYNPLLDQIAVSSPTMNEIWILDHSTTTAEAAGHEGGRSGKGGDLLYRWGNPQSYRAGTESDQQLFFQHDIKWIEDGLPGAGHLLLYNNGRGRSPVEFSSVDELIPPFDSGSWSYTLTPGLPYAPGGPFWSYRAPVETDFFSGFISGADRQPNGNTLIVDGAHGHLFETTPFGDVVWSYINPVTANGPVRQGEPVPEGNRSDRLANLVFRTHRYAPDFPGLVGLDLTPKGTVELPRSTPVEEFDDTLPQRIVLFQNYPNPFARSTTIVFDVSRATQVHVRVFDVLGRVVVTLLDGDVVEPGRHEIRFDGTQLSGGVYFIRLDAAGVSETRQMVRIR